MALVSGPGRGGLVAGGDPAQEWKLVLEKHVDYIKSLDTVRQPALVLSRLLIVLIDHVVRGETSWIIGSRSTYE